MSLPPAASSPPLPAIEVEPVPHRAEPRSQAAGLTTAAGDAIDPREVTAHLEGLGAAETIAWALETFQPRLRFACSFQKTTSVTIDIASGLSAGDRAPARFFYLDTGLLFDETYSTRDALAARYGIEFERFAGIGLDEQAALYGDRLWARQPDACCGIRKVEPMRNALTGIDCWVSGIRREDSPTRAAAAKFGWDRRFGLWKLNPLADWTAADVREYIDERQIPYNPLHDAGYPSIGCTHCTRPPGAGGDPRSGRWADAHKTECGLHG
ncbi:MAG: phosphoadenylyl-sulfate reductase [Solirubrobacterales bacterium]